MLRYTSTRPTLNLLRFLLLHILHASVCALTLEVSHAPISFECLLSMALLQQCWHVIS